MHASSSTPTGDVTHRVVRSGRVRSIHGDFWHWPSVMSGADVREHGLPHRGLPAEVNAWRLDNVRHLQRGWRRIGLAKMLGVPTMFGAVWHTVIRGDGTVIPYGLASMRLVTTAGCGFVVDGFQNLVELEDMKYHGFGTGTTAEASGDTALVTELTTQYTVNSTRPTGTTAEGASANIYRSVATLTPDSGGSIVLREHGVFSNATVGSGVLLDRSVFAAITLDSAAGDSLQTTYELTLVPGS